MTKTHNTLTYFIAAACLQALTMGVADAQTQCGINLADHSNDKTNQGFKLSLEAQADSSGVCHLNSVSIALSVGDGAQYHHVNVPRSWQTGVVYTAKAVITKAGPQQLSLALGAGAEQSLPSVQGSFQPAQATFFGSYDSDPGSADYVVRQVALQVSNGSKNLALAPNGNNPIPLPLILLAGGPAPWPAAFTEDATQPTTITAAFQIDAFDSAVSNQQQYNPYVDMYGQAIKGDWPSKVKTPSDLQASIAAEQAWLATNERLGGMDQYGGSTLAGWTDKSSDYYHVASHNNRWYLISPLGNPMFYTGITGVYPGSTPITGRESMFDQLPLKTDPLLAEAYSQDSQNTIYFSFDMANQIRKYGSTWKKMQDTLLQQRLAGWGFAGAGKFAPHVPPGVPVTPVLEHDPAKVPSGVPAVPNIVLGGHPDVFDPGVFSKDPTVVTKLRATLTAQIGSDDTTNKYIVGWSVGNEDDEIVQLSEVKAILAMGASVPAKKALVDYAYSQLYGSDLSKLKAAWNIAASTLTDAYAATPTPSLMDLDMLRQFYERSWYSALSQTVKSIDANHPIYFGSWIPAGPNMTAADWKIAADNSDVIGFDDFSPGPLSSELQDLISGTAKPVMLGAWGAPPDYGGTRGFGWSNYTQALTLSDSASGDAYIQRLQSAGANPYVVGAMWFAYRDEPVSGRGGTGNTGSASTSSLVVGENFAFGMVDTTDTPKYDLINKVRAANIAALQSRGLIGSAPVLTSGTLANGATYVPGGLVPGSWALVKGANLATTTRVWADADFTGLGNKLPTNLSGTQVMVNGVPAAAYYVSPTQVSFQAPTGITGTSSVQVIVNGQASNTVSAAAATNAPGIFPIIVNGTNYAAGVFLDGKIAGDPAIGPAFRNAKPGDVVALFATGLIPTPAGVLPSLATVSGVTVTIGDITVSADFAGLVAVGEFQINFTVPQQFANRAAGNYPISIQVNAVSSPLTIDSSPPGQIVLPIQH